MPGNWYVECCTLNPSRLPHLPVTLPVLFPFLFLYIIHIVACFSRVCPNASLPQGYSPSSKDAASLPTQVDYKAFQTFLTGALHAEDLAESFQQFFALFDTQVMTCFTVQAKLALLVACLWGLRLWVVVVLGVR